MLKIKFLPVNLTHYIGPLIVFTIAFIAFVFDQQIADVIIYNHSLITEGEYWRLITGHFLHTNTNHFILNVTAVVLLWALHGQYYNHINYPLVFLISATVCGLSMYWFSPNITLYVGLSGVLHGFFIWGALMDIKHQEKTGYLLLIGVILKVAHEQFYGASSDVESFIGATVAIDAHMFGAIGGLLAFLLPYLTFILINKANKLPK